MDFSPHVDKLLTPFIKSFGKCEKTEISKKDFKTYNSILISLYKDIYSSNKFVFNQGCFKSRVINSITENHLVNKPNVFSVRYFPEEIQDYIKNEEKYQLVFSCGNVGGREIHIHFSLFSKTELNNLDKYVNYVRMMYVWLNICAKYASKYCTKTLNIFIYLTPFTKQLPSSSAGILGPEHVNTAFTATCVENGQLVIFREEEWFKVFIHETFHTYGLDFSSSHFEQFKQSLSTIFPINSEFMIYEAYTETWARIINCVFCSFNALKNKKDKETFILNLNFCLELERMFSIYQCIKVLGFMGLSYNDIYDSNMYDNNTDKSILRNNLYRENTHVFAYFIMTAIFLNDYSGFMIWCKKHNENLLKFNSTDDNFIEFFEYIKHKYNCISLLNNITEMKKLISSMIKSKTKHKELLNSTRMSIVHTI